MTTSQLIIYLACIFVLAPVLAYMIVKFGAAGYFRAKDRNNKQQTKKDKDEIEKQR